MSAEGAAPPHARLVYNVLIAAGLLAAAVGAATIGVIVYNYVTRVELREPAPRDGGHATLPDWTAWL